MINVILARFKQKYRTYPFPRKEPVMPEKFRGMPIIDNKKCSQCAKCVAGCPTQAISKEDNQLKIDLGRCIFCVECKNNCEVKAMGYSRDYRLAASTRNDLIVDGKQELKLAKQLNREIIRLFGRSLRLRQVSAGGCNACEFDTNVLNTLVFDLGRFGIQFVASPRHADGILVTGPVTENMKLALLKTYEAVASSKLVIALGACAISGGLYRDDAAKIQTGLEGILPIDLYVPGCPPHPYTILDGLLRLLAKR
jgi:Ni,Fe-hydrogenase III small subunit/ferredoxin